MAKKEAKTNKKENNKNKRSFMKDFKAELKKVIWPTPKQLFNNTVAVLTIVIITAIIVFVLDVAFESINKFGVNKLKQDIVNSASNNTVENEETTTNNDVEENTESNKEEDKRLANVLVKLYSWEGKLLGQTITDEKGNYVFTSTVNYPNNRNLIKQKVTVDKKMMVKKVVVLNDNDVPKITLNVKNTDKNPKFSKNYFEIEDIMNTVEINEEQTKETSSIDDIIYPLVVPEGTKLKSEEKLNKTGGERVILTFEGEKPFLLVEETVKQEDELTIIPTMGEPYMFMDTIGALSDNSLTWSSGNMEYYLVSDVMNQEELIEVASSINVLPTMK